MIEEFAEVNAKKTITVTLTRTKIETYLRSKGWRQEVTGKWRSKDGHELLNCVSLQQVINGLECIEKRDSYAIVKDIG